MGTITKENLLFFVNEQISSTMQIDEFPNRKLGEEPKDWRIISPRLNPPKIFRVNQFKDPAEVYRSYKVKSLIGSVKILSLKPEVKAAGREEDVKFNFAKEEELISDTMYCYEVWESKTNPSFKLYAFDNYGYLPTKIDIHKNKLYPKFKMFIWVKDDEPNVPQALFRNEPRNSFFQTQYKWKEEPQYSSETYTKKYIHYYKINEFFNDPGVKMHLYKCGLPPIMAYKTFDHPITHKINEQKYSAPYYNFLLSGIWPSTDIQSALDLIIQYRESIALGEEPPEMPPPTHMPRNPRYKSAYARGNWEFNQKIAGPENAERTKRLKLWMKAIAGGELSFYVGTDLQIIGSVDVNNRMVMTATFSVVSENRSAGKEWANYKVEPIPPISVNTMMNVPENIDLIAFGQEDLQLVRGSKGTPEFKFLNEMYDNLLGKLTNKILEIDPDQAIDRYLMFEPSDIETEIEENTINEGQKKKIVVTEEQLKMLMSLKD